MDKEQIFFAMVILTQEAIKRENLMATDSINGKMELFTLVISEEVQSTEKESGRKHKMS